jgi:quercetin dioxygenase-like cupin family protein
MAPPTVAGMNSFNDTGATPAVPYVLDEDEGEVIRWFAATLTIKASGPSFDVAVTTEIAGSEPPLHVHARDDEALHILEGDLTVFAGDEVLRASTGSFVFLPRGIPHTFAVDSGSARVLLILAPSGAISMFSDNELHFGQRGMPTRPRRSDLAVVAAALEPYGITVRGPNPRHSGDGAVSAPATPGPERKRR